MISWKHLFRQWVARLFGSGRGKPHTLRIVLATLLAQWLYQAVWALTAYWNGIEHRATLLGVRPLSQRHLPFTYMYISNQILFEEFNRSKYNPDQIINCQMSKIQSTVHISTTITVTVYCSSRVLAPDLCCPAIELCLTRWSTYRVLISWSLLFSSCTYTIIAIEC